MALQCDADADADADRIVSQPDTPARAHLLFAWGVPVHRHFNAVQEHLVWYKEALRAGIGTDDLPCWAV
jgi:hypothetical protein